jgi:hypothetical protein
MRRRLGGGQILSVEQEVGGSSPPNCTKQTNHLDEDRVSPIFPDLSIGKFMGSFLSERSHMNKLDKSIGVIDTAAAIFWLRSAPIEVPDNNDALVQELQRIAWWNSWAAWASVVASLCAAWAFY